MKQSIALLLVFVGGWVLADVAAADDAADVLAAQLAQFAAYNASDAEAVARYVLLEQTRFVGNGSLLTDGFSKSDLKAAFDSGVGYDRQLRHLDVKVYGTVAVVTGYWTGTVIFPDGVSVTGPMRHSAVWIKQGDLWKVAHRHNSPLTTEPMQ